MGNKGIRDYGITIGTLETGANNLITDVKGVMVGHCTLNNGRVKTGVTALLPHEGDIFHEKLLASAYVLNGFGKTTGLVQIEEMGTIETPIILTNTLSVGTAYDALVEYMLEKNDDIGLTTGTVNPVICECNDGCLNDIRGRHVKKEHVFQSIKNAGVFFEQGAVGAGTGMVCYGLKGGIGSSSRIIDIEGEKYMMGALVLTNFGRDEDLTIDGIKAGRLIFEKNRRETDKGSIIVIIATDVPLSERQLKRVCKRAAAGIIRTGSFIGNGSGEIIISFSTANSIRHYEICPVITMDVLNEDHMDMAFRAAAESTEEAVLNSLIHAETTPGRMGNMKYSLKDYIDLIVRNP